MYIYIINHGLQQSVQENLENLVLDIINDLSRRVSGPEMEVFKLLMEIVKETSSIIRKDDQLSSKLQTAIKEGVIEEVLGNKQKDSAMQLVDDEGGIKELQNLIPLDNDLEYEYDKNTIPKGLKAQFQVALSGLKEKLSENVMSTTKIDSGKANKMFSDAFRNLWSIENSKANSRRKRESQNKTGITPELIAYLLDKHIQESFLEEDQSKRESNCLIQILWNIDGKYKGKECSKLSQDLGKKVRKLLFMILKKELPSSLFFLDFEKIMKEFMSRGQELEKDAKTLAMKFLLPITGEDLREILTPIVKIFEKPIFGNEKLDIMFNGILRFIIKTESLNKLAANVRQVQKEIILR